jgi:deoxycytidine triphosphate deaminase
MKFIGTDSLKKLLRFAPDPEKQTEGDRIVFTVLDIMQIVGEGTIDPDKSSTEPARRIKRPLKKSTRDAAGSWDLTQGAYWATCSETVQIPDGAILMLEPHQALMENGLWHPALIVRDWAEFNGVLLVVSAKGVRLMEGAPISTGFIFI